MHSGEKNISGNWNGRIWVGWWGFVEIEMLSPSRPYHRLGTEEKQLGSQGRMSGISTQSKRAERWVTRRPRLLVGCGVIGAGGDRLKSLRLCVCLTVLLRLMSRPAY